MTIVTLVGVLASPGVRAALGAAHGTDVAIAGKLSDGVAAGIKAGAWPDLSDADGAAVAGWRTGWTDALRRYARVFGLRPVGPDRVIGIGSDRRVRRVDGGAVTPPPDDPLVAEIARRILASRDHPAKVLAARLPLIAGQAAATLRAAQHGHSAAGPGPAGTDRVRTERVSEPYAAYFSVELHRFRHRLHGGGWSGPVDRAVFLSSDAAVVLPWDPVRDRVLLVDQFRAGPAVRGDADAWLYEPVAGRIDAGETPEDAARREALEEANLTLTQLFPAPGHYPSPGIIAEYIYSFVGIAELPDDAATVSGLASEDEDIRGHIFPRQELTRMALDGRIRNGPLLILALWLDRKAKHLRASLS